MPSFSFLRIRSSLVAVTVALAFTVPTLSAQQPPATKPAAKPAATTKPAAAPAPPAAAKAAKTAPLIDINHATVKELKTIPGIGDAYAAKIVAGRPYANKSQLVSRNIIASMLYETIQGMIIAKQ